MGPWWDTGTFNAISSKENKKDGRLSFSENLKNMAGDNLSVDACIFRDGILFCVKLRELKQSTSYVEKAIPHSSSS